MAAVQAIGSLLEAIWSSALPLAERRRLCARAVAARALCPEGRGGGVSAVLPVDGTLSWLEEGLCAVADGLRTPRRITVSQAKKALRERGRHDLASRVGRLSKLRNGAAHPDVGLVAAIREAFVVDSKAGSGGDSNGVASGSDAEIFFIGDNISEVGVQTDIGSMDMRVLSLDVTEQGTQCVAVSVDVDVQCDFPGYVAAPMPGSAASTAEACFTPDDMLHASDRTEERSDASTAAREAAASSGTRVVCHPDRTEERSDANEDKRTADILRAEGCSQSTIDWCIRQRRAHGAGRMTNVEVV